MSGGLDSRAMLAVALDAGVEVHAVTFGTPGTYDFEFGSGVARQVGIRHTAMDLRTLAPDTEALVAAVRAGGRWTYTFDAYYNRLITNEFGAGTVVLSGFLGETVAGAHYPGDITSAEDAFVAFVGHERFTSRRSLVPSNYNPENSLEQYRSIARIPGISLYETIDFAVRQRGAIRPIVVDDRFDVRTPFADPRWLSLMFSAPTEWRQKSLLYEEALRLKWPRLFRLPTKNHKGSGLVAPWERRVTHLIERFGRRLRCNTRPSSKVTAPAPMLNYIDFREGFASQSPLRALARENLADLKARGVITWLDPEQVLAEHGVSGVDNSREIQVLVGLEINLKAS
nr:asparagine synthase-related protein [Thiocapsa imhoffii]